MICYASRRTSFKESRSQMKLFSFIIFSLSASTLLAYPDGAPTSACQSLVPDHYAPSEDSSSPVRVVLSNLKIKPGDTITVRIESIEKNFQFMGFIVQPRSVANTNSIIGTMKSGGSDTQIINCSGLTTATHTNNKMKSFVTTTWTAPTDFTGGVQFQWVSGWTLTLEIWFKKYWITAYRLCKRSRCFGRKSFRRQSKSNRQMAEVNGLRVGRRNTFGGCLIKFNLKFCK